MNESQRVPPYIDDEIDIKDLLKKVISALERGMKIIILSIMLGAFLGVSYFFYSKVTFQSTMVLSSDILVLANISTLIAPLELLIKEGNAHALEQKLHLREEVTQKLKALEVESVFESEADNKETTSYFEITASVSDNLILPELQQGIIEYLKNNDYVKKRVAIKEEKLKVLIEKVDNEIKEIDLFKKRIESGAILSSGSSNVVLMEPTNLYQQSLLMMEKKQNFIEELALVDSIEIVKEFTPFNDPSSPSWIPCLVIGLAGGLVIGFAILFFKEMDRYVRS